MSKTEQILAASRAAIPAIKQEVVANKGHGAWQEKVRNVLIGLPLFALGLFLVIRGIDLLVAQQDVGKWLVGGGVVLCVCGVWIWDNELVAGAFKSIPGLLAAGISGILGAFRKPDPPPNVGPGNG